MRIHLRNKFIAVKISLILIQILILLLSAGCSKNSRDIATKDSVVEEVSFSDINISSVESLIGKDNTIDEYTAIVNHTYELYGLEDDMDISYQYILGKDYSSVALRHIPGYDVDLFEDIGTIDLRGNSIYRYNEHQFIDFVQCEEKGLNGELVYSDDHFIVRIYDNRGSEVYSISLSFLGSEFEQTLPTAMALDKDSNLHFCIDAVEFRNNESVVDLIDSKTFYFVVSSSGEILLKKELPDNIGISKAAILSDGTVALVSFPAEMGKHYEEMTYNYLVYNGTDFDTVFSYSHSVLSEDFPVYLMEDGNVLMADSVGVYLCDHNLKEKQPLYRWINHGIRVSTILDIRPQGEGIGVIYKSGELANYVYLEPVKEKIEMRTVTVAASASTEKIYKEAATDFNRLYPSCNIEVVRYDSDDTLMLTEINAGKGPVLIDTTLTGFDTKKEIWEPLDKVLDDMGILNDLNPQALEWGKIDGHIYGITTDFYIYTTVVGKEEYADLNYEDFSNLIKNGSFEYLTNSIDPASDAYRLFSECFIHGYDDNNVLDAEKEETAFSSDDFKSLIRTLKDKVSDDDYIKAGKEIYDGSILFNQLSITGPMELFAYMTIYGDDAIFAGYPHKDGSHSLIASHMPLALRKNATKEEKEIACVFIKTLLSYESQLEMAKSYRFGFSVREDVLEKQMDAFDMDTTVSLAGLDPIKINSDITNQIGKDTLYSILSDSKANKTFPRELNDIISEELLDYFQDNITVEEMCDHLENRVKLYLMEQ